MDDFLERENSVLGEEFNTPTGGTFATATGDDIDGPVEAAVRAARRVNDFATAVRVFEGVREKVENKQQYQAYLEELKGLREELGAFAC